MAIDKQVKSIQMGAYIYNGEFRAFAGYPASFDVWNAEIGTRMDFIDSSHQRTLSGREIGGVAGYRWYANIDLDNATPTASSSLRTLFNKFSSYYQRLFYPTSGSVVSSTISVGGSTVTLDSNAPAVTGYFVGCILFNVTTNQSRLITSYSSGRVATVQGDITGWTTGNNIQIYAPPSFPTVLGVSPNSNTANIEYFNMDSALMGVLRELTINKQVVQINARGVNLIENIPDSVRVG